MNELTTLSDAELKKEIDNIKERELALHTESGMNYITIKMRECIGLLETWGYKFDGDELALAKLWANGLSKEFVRLGADGILKAVTKWAQEDKSDYRVFPKIPWIAEYCAQIGGDPRQEMGRRMQAQAEADMEAKHREEMENFKKEHPDLWEKAKRKAEEMSKGLIK